MGVGLIANYVVQGVPHPLEVRDLGLRARSTELLGQLAAGCTWQVVDPLAVDDRRAVQQCQQQILVLNHLHPFLRSLGRVGVLLMLPSR